MEEGRSVFKILTGKVTGWELEKAPHEELHSLHRPPNIIRVIKSRRLKWAVM